jgi:hypothetical protein
MNGGKDIKLGDDKRPVSIVPNNEQDLYNIANGERLTDEFRNPLIAEVDTIFLPDASAKRSTSVVLPEREGFTIRSGEVSVASTTATYPNISQNNVGIDTTNIEVGDIIVGSSIPDATTISRVGIGSIYISNFSTNISPITETVSIKRKTQTRVISNPVIKVEEQFRETSETSITLLGVNRAEVQLSLFSNVSSYGIDPDEFESYSSGSGTFGSWDNRRNAIYGNRYFAKLTEETQESAIQLASFPVPYTFPFGPKFQRLGLYNELLFERYQRFIALGNALYDYYDSGAGSFYPSQWKNKFLSKNTTYVLGDDVIYAKGFAVSFTEVDTWTDTWRDIRDSQLKDPITNETFNFSKVSEVLSQIDTEDLNSVGLFSIDVNSTNTRPGYSESGGSYAQLQTKRVFRYQPGRISGFTFGVRSSAEPVSGIINEWGISNPTDQYVFRIKAGQLSIVRRSTIPLEPSVLRRNNLTPDDQVRISSGDPFDSQQYWTVEIPRDKFNGDPLNSNGPSGYLLKPENVTMYKIEFGWYGAIGARFYVYIPTDSGDARWVVIHTLIIENSLGSPCLADSYFRLKYSLNIGNSSDIRTPQYLYKYGASYYIDGGDEGSSEIYSVSSKQKTISSFNASSVIGILPKRFILNKDSVPITNRKLIIPTELNVSTDSLTEVKVVTCSACPGFGYVYTPGVATTESGRYIDIQFSDPNTISAINDSYFLESDIGAKIIAPSIYNAYITDVSDPVGIGESFLSASIKGFGGLSSFNLVNRDIGGSLVLDRVLGISTIIPLESPYPHPVRLSNYDVYAASNSRLYGSTIDIQFANPGSGDDYAHVADFLIGVTNIEPDISNPDILNGFIIGAGTTTILPNNKILFGEYTHRYAELDENGVEFAEVPSGRMNLQTSDPRISPTSLSNPGGGICSKLTINILDPLQIRNVTEFNYYPDTTETNPPPDPQGRRWIQIEGVFPLLDYDQGQIAIVNSSGTVSITNSRFVGLTSSYTRTIILQDGSEEVKTFSFIQISQTLSQSPNFTISIRPVQSTGDYVNVIKLFDYNVYPLYLVAKLKDNASINNLTIRETIGDFQRTITPVWYVSGNAFVTDAGGNANVSGEPPTNFQELYRSSSALIDLQNTQKLRPYVERDTLYVGANSTQTIDLTRIFGTDKKVITPDISNTEATFIMSKKIDEPGFGTIEASINFKEQ